MSFKAIITEEYTEMNGNMSDKLAGLACYIEALLKNDVPKTLIEKVIDMVFEKNKKEKVVETILDFDLNNLTTEEAMKVIDKEIKKMFD